MGCGATKVAPADAVTSDGKVVSLTLKDRAEMAQVVGRAFAGTASNEPEWAFHWALGPQLPDRADPERAKVLEYMLGMAIMGYDNMLQLGVKGAGGELQAVMFGYRSPGGEKGYSMCAMMMAAMSMPAPAGYKKNSAKFDKRLKAVDSVMKASHKKYGSGPHFYTMMMAVDPPNQGGGLCSLCMRALCQLADAEGLPCYLECSGKRTRDIYAHYGYEEKERYMLAMPDDKGHEPFTEFYAMVRAAKK